MFLAQHHVQAANLVHMHLAVEQLIVHHVHRVPISHHQVHLVVHHAHPAQLLVPPDSHYVICVHLVHSHQIQLHGHVQQHQQEPTYHQLDQVITHYVGLGHITIKQVSQYAHHVQLVHTPIPMAQNHVQLV